MTEALANTLVTIKHVEEALQKHFAAANTIEKFHAETIGDKSGFLSVILRLQLQWSG